MLNPQKFLKLLSDSTRLRCLMLLLQQEELCVCELTYALNTIQPKISRHFATLRKAGVVCDRRAGQWIHYRINPELPGWAMDLLQATLGGIKDQKQFKTDLTKLRGMSDRPDKRVCS